MCPHLAGVLGGLLWVRVVCGQRDPVYAWALSLPVSDKASPGPLTLQRLCYLS